MISNISPPLHVLDHRQTAVRVGHMLFLFFLPRLEQFTCKCHAIFDNLIIFTHCQTYSTHGNNLFYLLKISCVTHGRDPHVVFLNKGFHPQDHPSPSSQVISVAKVITRNNCSLCDDDDDQDDDGSKIPGNCAKVLSHAMTEIEGGM